jgi:hypothetical protein
MIAGGWPLTEIGADFPGAEISLVEMDSIYLGEGAQEVVGVRYARSSRSAVEPNELRVLVVDLSNGGGIVFEGGWSFGLRVYSTPDPASLADLNDA